MSYASERAEIKSAFEDGMDELFRTMFTETVLLYPLDEELTKMNVYQETTEKVYKKPFVLTAQPILTREQGEGEEQTIEQTSKFVFPNKQLVEAGVPHLTDADLETLQKWAIVFQGYVFLVDKVTPRTMVADTFLFYDFRCTTRDKDSTTTYTFPAPDISGETPPEQENPEEPDPDNPDNLDVPEHTGGEENEQE